MLKRLTLALAALAASAAPAFAHLDPAEHGSLLAGLSHPLSGADHILAMACVGLWAALLGGRAVWQVPAAFLVAMIAGFVAALLGVGLPFVEPVIAASVVVLGLLALVALQVPTPAGMALVGFFALFHGHAHGCELGQSGALPFLAGFLAATALLHAAGTSIGLGLPRLVEGKAGRLLARAAGALTAFGGLWIFAGA